jgi:hypothetical protein
MGQNCRVCSDAASWSGYESVVVCSLRLPTRGPAVRSNRRRPVRAGSRTISFKPCAAGADITALDPITADIAGAFEAGPPSTFAQQHLVHGSCH